MIFQETLTFSTRGRGLHPITSEISQAVSQSTNESGLLHCFIQHTSASLIIQENADPTARQDMESFLDRLVPDGQSWHEHTLEGPDDTTSHMKSAITNTSLTIPVHKGQLAMGTWQGIYLWEHRSAPHQRTVVATMYGNPHA